jgi:hypothetical protein
MTMLIPLYLIIGVILIAMLSGFDGPAITAALRRDLRSLRERGTLAFVAVGPVWLAGAVVAWPVVVACETIAWRERSVARAW